MIAQGVDNPEQQEQELTSRRSRKGPRKTQTAARIRPGSWEKHFEPASHWFKTFSKTLGMKFRKMAKKNEWIDARNY